MNRKSIVFLVTTLIALLNALIYWSVKPIWFFINLELGSFFDNDQFYAKGIGYLMVTWFFFQLIYTVIHLRRSSQYKKINKPFVVFTLLFTVILSSMNGYLYSMLGSEKQIIVRNLNAISYELMVAILLIFMIIFFPKLKVAKHLALRLSLFALLFILVTVSATALTPIKITSGPLVQYLDDDTFALIWTTNKLSKGFVEYGTDPEHMIQVSSSNNGQIAISDTVHKVLIDEPLDSHTKLRVGNMHIKEYFQNNVVYGDTIYSDFIDYVPSKSNDVTSFYIFSDVHEQTRLYEKFLNDDPYDFLVLNGDILSSVDEESLIVSEMFAPLTNNTPEFKPFYFVRGNHETRGKATRSLPNYLALPNNQFYYTFSYGPVFAIVLDSGEDKSDDHIEYGGLADYEAYKREETLWLETVLKSDAYKDAAYVVAFSHIPLNSYESLDEGNPFKEIESEWVALLNAIEIDVLFSGHTHRSEFIDSDDQSFNFPIIISGGYLGHGMNYEALKVDVSNDKMSVKVIDESGQIINDYSIEGD